mmetsp:Transcript_50277/g.129581  ORF Transcript_50277/g.129581 Transcript_50277/m.129581 type:complete len:207 (-) Transcript_50277:1216-1836(-)
MAGEVQEQCHPAGLDTNRPAAHVDAEEHDAPVARTRSQKQGHARCPPPGVEAQRLDICGMLRSHRFQGHQARQRKQADGPAAMATGRYPGGDCQRRELVSGATHSLRLRLARIQPQPVGRRRPELQAVARARHHLGDAAARNALREAQGRDRWLERLVGRAVEPTPAREGAVRIQHPERLAANRVAQADGLGALPRRRPRQLGHGA